MEKNFFSGFVVPYLVFLFPMLLYLICIMKNQYHKEKIRAAKQQGKTDE